MASEQKELAKAAKERGNALFQKKTREGYEQALSAYQEAIGHDPDDHIFYANCSGCHFELGNEEYEPRKKVECYARALAQARECTKRDPAWAKGYVRQSAAEFELIRAVAKWEERKIQDEKWRKQDEERAEQDRKEGREPYLPTRSEVKELDPELKDVAGCCSYVSCEASCRKGLELDPKSAPLRSRLQALRDAGHVTEEAKDREMCDKGAAAEMKAQGNAAFSSKNWAKAVESYTKALEQDPFDHVFYSNRSACYAEQEEFEKALRDAERCIAINSQFAKGYSRQAHALFHVGRYVDMEAAAKKGLEIDSASAALQDLLKQAQVETSETPEVQAAMHKLRQDKKQDAKLQDLMRGLNMQGNNIQMFNPGADGDLSGLLNGLKGGGFGGSGMGGFGGGGKSRMTEEQMRAMARATATAQASAAGAGYVPPATPAEAPTSSAEPAGPASAGPTSFAPK